MMFSNVRLVALAGCCIAVYAASERRPESYSNGFKWCSPNGAETGFEKFRREKRENFDMYNQISMRECLNPKLEVGSRVIFKRNNEEYKIEEINGDDVTLLRRVWDTEQKRFRPFKCVAKKEDVVFVANTFYTPKVRKDRNNEDKPAPKKRSAYPRESLTLEDIKKDTKNYRNLVNGKCGGASGKAARQKRQRISDARAETDLNYTMALHAKNANWHRHTEAAKVKREAAKAKREAAAKANRDTTSL